MLMRRLYVPTALLLENEKATVKKAKAVGKRKTGRG